MIDKRLNLGRKNIANYISSIDSIKNALDIGAGNGDDLLIIRTKFPKAKLNAIECYPPCIEKLQKNKINVFNIDIERTPLPLEDESMDLIIINQVLEHVKEIFWIFSEISRVLKSGGKLIIGVPNLASLHNRLLLLFGLQPTSIQTHSAHIRGFTKKDLIKFMNIFNNGYKIQGYSGSNFYPFPPILAKPLAKLFPSCAWSMFLFFEKQQKYNNEYIEFPKKQSLATNFYTGDSCLKS